MPTLDHFLEILYAYVYALNGNGAPEVQLILAMVCETWTLPHLAHPSFRIHGACNIFDGVFDSQLPSLRQLSRLLVNGFNLVENASALTRLAETFAEPLRSICTDYFSGKINPRKVLRAPFVPRSKNLFKCYTLEKPPIVEMDTLDSQPLHFAHLNFLNHTHSDMETFCLSDSSDSTDYFYGVFMDCVRWTRSIGIPPFVTWYDGRLHGRVLYCSKQWLQTVLDFQVLLNVDKEIERANYMFNWLVKGNTKIRTVLVMGLMVQLIANESIEELGNGLLPFFSDRLPTYLLLDALICRWPSEAAIEQELVQSFSNPNKPMTLVHILAGFALRDAPHVLASSMAQKWIKRLSPEAQTRFSWIHLTIRDSVSLTPAHLDELYVLAADPTIDNRTARYILRSIVLQRRLVPRSKIESTAEYNVPIHEPSEFPDNGSRRLACAFHVLEHLSKGERFRSHESIDESCALQTRLNPPPILWISEEHEVWPAFTVAAPVPSVTDMTCIKQIKNKLRRTLSQDRPHYERASARTFSNDDIAEIKRSVERFANLPSKRCKSE